MLVKRADDKSGVLAELRRLIGVNDAARARKRIQDEINNIVEGDRGERDTAFHLDAALGGSDDFAIVHDLTLQHEGSHAQIDHLVVTHRRQVFVIETKSVTGTMRLDAEGSCTYLYRSGKRFQTSSPIEQVRRHANVVRDWLGSTGSSMREVIPVVAVAPRTTVVNESGEDGIQIVRTDALPEWLKRRETADDRRFVVTSPDFASCEEVAGAAWLLSRAHRPRTSDWAMRLGVDPMPMPTDLLDGLAEEVARPLSTRETYIAERNARDERQCPDVPADTVDADGARYHVHGFPDGRGALKLKEGRDGGRLERIARAYGGYRRPAGHWILPHGTLELAVEALRKAEAVQEEMFEPIDITIPDDRGEGPVAVRTNDVTATSRIAPAASRSITTPCGPVTMRPRADGHVVVVHGSDPAIAAHVRAVCMNRAELDPSSGLWIVPPPEVETITHAIALPTLRIAS